MSAKPSAEDSNASAGVACGELECRRFASSAQAFAEVLALKPLALGIGETHALAGSEQIVPAARRFANELLPALAAPLDSSGGGAASHLIVELLRPNPGCHEASQDVRDAQRPVTREQTRTAQDDYVLLGQRAKELGIEPFILSPTCDELRAIATAGDRAIELSLTTIAKVTERMVRAALVQNRKAGRERVVLAYGGALHNDQNPAASRADFSYGKALGEFTLGRYVELDLIVREFIKDSDAWRALPWYAHFDPQLYPDESVLLRTGPSSFVLFFPRTS